MTRRSRRPCRPLLFPLEGREVPALVGGLDPSFGTGGLLTTDFGFTDTATGVAVQADGKIVVAGSADGGSPAFAVARYNPDGSLDTTFDGDGLLLQTFGGIDQATAVAVQDDGKIVVAGYTNGTGATGFDFAVVRLNADGSFDTTFDGDGKATIGFDLGGVGREDDKANAVVIQSDGAIVLAGSVQRAGLDDVDFGVVRLLANGALDAGFSGDGKAVVAFDLAAGFREDVANAVAVQADGLIVVAGYAQRSAADFDFAVARLKTDGAPDPTFDADGRATIDFGDDDRAADVLIRPDGRIVAVGTWDGGAADFAVAQLNADGSLDATFGGGAFGAGSGKTNLTFGAPTFGGVERAAAAALQPDGRLVLVGTTDAGGGVPNNVGVARLNADGTLDPTFDADGKEEIDFGGDDQGAAVALQADGRIIVAGSSGGNFAVARLFGTVGSANQAIATGTADGKGVLYAAAPGAAQFTTPGTSIDLLPGTTAESVRATVADVNGDGVLDRVAVSGPGAPVTLTVRSGVDNSILVASFGVFEASFTGGAFVAAADLDGDGRAEVLVSPDQGGGPVVAVYSGSKLAAGLTGDAAQVVRFFGIDDPDFRGGARVAVGDVNADGTPDLVVSAGFLGGPRIAVFQGTDVAAGDATPARLVTDFFAFENTVRNGAFVAVGDVDGDGFADLVFGGGPTAGPRVRVVSGQVLLSVPGLSDLDVQVPATPGLQIGNFFAGDPATRGGVPVAVKDVDGDARADVVAASGENLADFPALPSRVLVYLDETVLGGGATPAADQTLDPFASAELVSGVFVG